MKHTLKSQAISVLKKKKMQRKVKEREKTHPKIMKENNSQLPGSWIT